MKGSSLVGNPRFAFELFMCILKVNDYQFLDRSYVSYSIFIPPWVLPLYSHMYSFSYSELHCTPILLSYSFCLPLMLWVHLLHKTCWVNSSLGSPDWTVRPNAFTVHVVPARIMQHLEWGRTNILESLSSTYLSFALSHPPYSFFFNLLSFSL